MAFEIQDQIAHINTTQSKEQVIEEEFTSQSDSERDEKVNVDFTNYVLKLQTMANHKSTKCRPSPRGKAPAQSLKEMLGQKEAVDEFQLQKQSTFFAQNANSVYLATNIPIDFTRKPK